MTSVHFQSPGELVLWVSGQRLEPDSWDRDQGSQNGIHSRAKLTCSWSFSSTSFCFLWAHKPHLVPDTVHIQLTDAHTSLLETPCGYTQKHALPITKASLQPVSHTLTATGHLQRSPKVFTASSSLVKCQLYYSSLRRVRANHQTQ